jgi:hypothetical protein
MSKNNSTTTKKITIGGGAGAEEEKRKIPSSTVAKSSPHQAVSFDSSAIDNTLKPKLDNGQTATQFAENHTAHEMTEEIRKLVARETLWQVKKKEMEKEMGELKSKNAELSRWETDFTQKIKDHCNSRNLEFRFFEKSDKMFRVKDPVGVWNSYEDIHIHRESLKQNPDHTKIPKKKIN